MKALSRRTQARLAELESIRAANKRGVLTPPDVVEAARNPASSLHDYFEWDDSRAAVQFRVAQARQLIREVEVILENGKPGPVVPFYLSLAKDRREAGGGYRPTSSVLSDRTMRRQLLTQIGTDLEFFHSRWSSMTPIMRELAPVLRAHDEFRQEHVDVLPLKKRKSR